ncbi:MAG TPA: VCBS repeat-containing protein [Humisphaera sp.]|nr:VCBS repeat-containing protein [Humisphaera sp.]
MEESRPASAAVCAERLEDRLCLTTTGISFHQVQSFQNRTTMIATGDFNHDGSADLVTVDGENDLVRVYLNKGDGTYNSPKGYNVNHARWVNVADYNADGNLDLAVLSPDGDGDSFVALLLGNGDGTFNKPIRSTTKVNASTETTADFNGDGLPDVAVSNRNHFSVMLNIGDGTFAKPVFYGPSDEPPRYITSADFNNDGVPDLALIRANNIVDVMLNQTIGGVGTGIFNAAVSAPLGEKPQIVVPGDFNGDGNIDLAAVNSDFQVAPVSILLGNGDGTFQPRRNYFGGNFVDALAVADFNGDGLLDLASSSYSSQMRVYPGSGDGTFLPEADSEAGKFGIFMATADLNNDGSPDILLVSGGGFRVLLNTSNTTPTPPGTPGTVDLTIGSGGTKSIKFAEAHGLTGTVSLSGPGTAVVRLAGDGLVQDGTMVHGQNIIIESINAVGTTLASTLNITSSSKSGVVDVNTIQIDGALKTLSAPVVLLHTSCLIDAAATTVKLDSAIDASISIDQQTLPHAPGFVPPVGTSTLTLNVTRADGMSVQSAETVQKINVGQWVSSDGTPATLAAPGVKNIQCSGSFSASLTIGTGGLGTFNGGARISSGTWNVLGDITTINAASLINTNITTLGNLQTLSVKQKSGVGTFINNNITAATINKASLGTIAFDNGGTPFGLLAHSIAVLSGKDLVTNKTFTINKVVSAAEVNDILIAKGINPGNFSARIV